MLFQNDSQLQMHLWLRRFSHLRIRKVTTDSRRRHFPHPARTFCCLGNVCAWRLGQEDYTPVFLPPSVLQHLPHKSFALLQNTLTPRIRYLLFPWKLRATASVQEPSLVFRWPGGALLIRTGQSRALWVNKIERPRHTSAKSVRVFKIHKSLEPSLASCSDASRQTEPKG